MVKVLLPADTVSRLKNVAGTMNKQDCTIFISAAGCSLLLASLTLSELRDTFIGRGARRVKVELGLGDVGRDGGQDCGVLSHRVEHVKDLAQIGDVVDCARPHSRPRHICW